MIKKTKSKKVKPIDKPDKLVLTAGPSITERERTYVEDAVLNGWNFNMDDYVVKFEKTLANYVGVKHCLGLTKGTHALHLALALFNIKPGDEVIIPDMTYVACSNVVEYTGAKPVFVDIDPVTWCIDPDAIKKAITPKTRAIMPVWMYGSSPRMEEIMDIANKHNLLVVEDSCPALGTIYKNKKAGTWGHIGTFSFQGAKIAVMGEGGALVTNSQEWDERARSLYDHGKDSKKQFWHNEIGFMYELSNLQAALGLAQVERIEELVAKKRQIFQWYWQRLSDLPRNLITMNYEHKNSRVNCWMTSIILGKKSPLQRDELRRALKERNIDTRQFFYPISMLPMYAGKIKVNNPNAYYVSLNGINLPSGVMLTEEQVDYIARNVKELLTRKAG